MVGDKKKEKNVRRTLGGNRTSQHSHSDGAVSNTLLGAARWRISATNCATRVLMQGFGLAVDFQANHYPPLL